MVPFQILEHCPPSIIVLTEKVDRNPNILLTAFNFDKLPN